MREVAPVKFSISPMRAEAVGKVRALEAYSAEHFPQTKIRIEHELHAGVYARTMIVPEMPNDQRCLVTSAFIRLPTLLLAEGDALLYDGEDLPLAVSDHTVFKAGAGRKISWLCASGFRLTMIFSTQAKTIEEAENEFTDEPHLLQTRQGN